MYEIIAQLAQVFLLTDKKHGSSSENDYTLLLSVLSNFQL